MKKPSTKKIEVKFVGFPAVYDFFKGSSIQYTFRGETLTNLIDELIAYYGEILKKSFMIIRTQSMDPTIQATVNGVYIKRKKFGSHLIKEGDQVSFLRLMAGG